MAQRSKMERRITESESSSSPATYQCIVCQMTTISLSRLHRHQTYEHTPEELSLSTIGLQCSLIKNLHSTNSIVYDNSWLCDPLKQAEFYTVSANLLNDCNNNPNNCNPVDYVVEKEDRNIKKQDIEIADELEIQDFDSRIDHSYGRVVNFAEDSTEIEMQIKRFRSIGTETNCAEFLEELTQPGASFDLCTETERIITYLEEVIQVEEAITIGAEANDDSKFLGKTMETEEFKAVDAMPNGNFDSPANFIQLEESKDINGRATAKEFEVVELKGVGLETNSALKSVDKSTIAEEFKVPQANSILKSAKKQMEAGEFKVPAGNSIIKSAKKVVNVVKPETDAFINCIENLCIDLEKIKDKPQKRKRASPRNPAPRKVKAAAKPRAPRRKAKTTDSVSENNTVNHKEDQQNEVFVTNNSLSTDCTELSKKSQKTKSSVQPPRKRTKISNFVPANITIKHEVDQETKIPVKNHCTTVNCAKRNLDNLTIENSAEPSRKKAKTSNCAVKSITVMKNAEKESEISTQNDCASIKATELSSESPKSENSIELSEKNDKTSNPVRENTTIIQETEEKTEVPAQNDLANINHTELTQLTTHRSGNSVKQIFSEEDIVEAQLNALFQQRTETQETEISVTGDSANSHWIDYHVVKTEPPIPNKEDLERDNFIQNYVDTCKAEIPAEIPVEIKSEDQLFPDDKVDPPADSEPSEGSVIAALPTTYTFPWYPPDINDCSILVLDPEAHQLVWTEVSIVDEKSKLQTENSPETVVLPELTEADLRDNEICENMTISSEFQTKESSENLLPSQTKGNAIKPKKKPCPNFVLRPRKTAGKKML